MNAKIESLVEQAKHLSPEEQAILTDALHEMLTPPTAEWETAWLKECEDRLAAYEQGEMQAHESEEVMARLSSKYSRQ